MTISAGRYTGVTYHIVQAVSECIDTNRNVPANVEIILVGSRQNHWIRVMQIMNAAEDEYRRIIQT